MALVNHTIRNLVQGVSQQTPSVRLDSQVEEQINMVPDVAFGLTKRNPIEMTALVDHSLSYDQNEENALFTFKDNDGSNVSMGVKSDGSLYRFDPSGLQFSFTAPIAYLAYTSPKDIDFLETNNVVYILNKTKTVDKVDLSTFYRDTGLVWITSIQTDQKFTIQVKKNDVPIYTNTATVLASDTISSFMLGWVNAINSLPDVQTAGGFVNSIFISFVASGTVAPSDQYIVTLSESFGLNVAYATMSANEYNTEALANSDTLPLLSISGTGTPFIARVSPTGAPKSNYYIGWKAETKIWQETSIRSAHVLDNLTMPYRIIKGTTPLNVATFNAPDITAGDLVSNPDPSFVGNTITDMFLYQGRVTFSSGGFLSFSEINEHRNFYRTSLAVLLKSDRIDIELQGDKLGYLPIINTFGTDGNLFINTGRGQSLLKTTTDLDLTKAKFSRVSSFDYGYFSPINIDNSVYFITENKGFSNVFGFSTIGGEQYVSEAITQHCPKYIEEEVVQAVRADRSFIIRGNLNKNRLYVQNTFLKNNNATQNAWYRWELPTNLKIKHVYTEGSILHLILDDLLTGFTCYGEVPLSVVNNVEETPTQIGYFPYLDMWTSTVADIVDTPETISVNIKTGEQVPRPLVDDLDVITGIPFAETSVTLSEQVPRTFDGEVNTKLGYAKMMLRRFQGTLGQTGRMAIEILKKGRGVNTQYHIPKVTGTLVANREPVSDTDLRFSVNGRAQDVQIKLKDASVYGPMQIISLEYQAQLITRGSKI